MAYALETLVQILEQDQHHANLACNPQIESLLKKARSLRDLCDKLSFPIVHPKSGDLESQIRDVVYKAEDLIESHIRDQVLSVLKDDTSELDLKNFMEEFDSIKEAILKIQALPEPVSSAIAGSSSVFDPGPNSNMVGLTEEFHQLLDQLLGRGPRLQIIPIVGMGGIGKTTLARQLFYHQNTVKCFDKRVWITFSQESSVRATLLAILGCLTNLTDEMRQRDDDQLGTIIRMLLTDQRYLIVVDDIWDLGTWDKIWGVCPANENCSRIILTTRVSTCYATCSSNHYQMRFMNGSESWELLCSEVFGEESFPPELEKVGKIIAERCQGLPLAIISMAKLLSGIEKKLEHWEHFVMIANLLEVHLDSEVDILSKSYSHLPCSLKPCFLYVGAFLGDHEIRVSRIVNLWIAEGFVSGENLEDTAESYLKALLDENLLLACQKEPNGRIKTFKIHFLLRKLCEKKAFEEKFLWFKHLEDEEVPEDKDQLRRVSMHPLVQPTNTMELASFVRSLLCLGPYSQRLAPFFLGLTLLRVLDVFQVEFSQFPKEILELVLLRYLSFSCHSNLPSSISRLRNLQTIVIRRFPSFREFSLPFELWELTQLRHIKCKETCIWNFPDNGAPQENLQTLSNIQVFVVTDSLLDNIPNLRKLGLFCNKLVQSVIHLDHLSKLEKLKCSSNLSQATHNFLSYLTFPPSLRKLSLVLCKIPCDFMKSVGSLPNLEQLKLRKCAFLVIGNKPTEVALEMEDPEEETEPTWQVEDQFSALISLQMEDLNLVHWKANETHFPKLEHLIIRGCSSLRELPVGIAERSSIKLIEVDEYCRPSVIASAKDRQKKPLDLEDVIFQVDTAECQEATVELFELDEEYSSVIGPAKDEQKKHIDLEDDIFQVDIGKTHASTASGVVSVLDSTQLPDVYISYPWESRMHEMLSIPNSRSFYSILLLPKASDKAGSHYNDLEDTLARAHTWINASQASGVPIVFMNIQTESLLTKISGDAASSVVNAGSLSDLSNLASISLYGFEDYHGVDVGVVRAVRMWFSPLVGEIPVEIKITETDTKLGFAISRTEEGFIYISSVIESDDNVPSARSGLSNLYKQASNASHLLVVSRISNQKVLPWSVSTTGAIRCFDTVSVSQKLSLGRRAMVPILMHVFLWDRNVNLSNVSSIKPRVMSTYPPTSRPEVHLGLRSSEKQETHLFTKSNLNYRRRERKNVKF